ncbi:uncharacterized protein LOC142343874 isoform X2 [Convolutriloba macropyga]|uniref:uncharacterized protein LOC142343874 isoform X2 n=1 Tax=Convolutriloba macropyga TaxID=536237 RepID=UPI003F520B7E
MPATASSSRRAGRKAVEIEPENDQSAVHKDEPSTVESARSRRRAVKVPDYKEDDENEGGKIASSGKQSSKTSKVPVRAGGRKARGANKEAAVDKQLETATAGGDILAPISDPENNLLMSGTDTISLKAPVTKSKRGQKKKKLAEDEVENDEFSTLPPPPPPPAEQILADKNEQLYTECNNDLAADKRARNSSAGKTSNIGNSTFVVTSNTKSTTARTSNELQLSETSEDDDDDDVEEKERKRLQKQAAANPFSFKNYVNRVATSTTKEQTSSSAVSGSSAVNSAPEVSQSAHDKLSDEPPMITSEPSSAETSDSGSLTSLDAKELKKENTRLRDEIEHNAHLLRNRNRRVTELEGELKAIRAKEKKEAETLDRQLKQLESNYRAAVGRVKELEMQVFHLEQGQGHSANATFPHSQPSNHQTSRSSQEVPEEFVNRSRNMAQQLNLVAAEGETQIKNMLSGIERLRQMADVISNMHKFSEQPPQ